MSIEAVATDDLLADLKEFERLSDVKEDLNGQLKEINQRRGALEARLAEAFALAGMQNINVNGATFYLSRRKFVSVNQDFRHAIIEEARKLGLDEFITLQPQRFSSWAQEWLDEPEHGGKLPEGIADKVNVYEKNTIGLRRG